MYSSASLSWIQLQRKLSHQNFPDLSGYAPVDVKDYTIDVPNPGRPSLPTVYFFTPDGIVCNFMHGQAQCSGNDFLQYLPRPQTLMLASPASIGSEQRRG